MPPAPQAMCMSRPHAGIWATATVILFALSVPTGLSQDAYAGACREISALDAIARGAATSVRVTIGETVIQPVESAHAEQVGPGNAHGTTQLMTIQLPGADSPLVTAELLKSRTDLDVDPDASLETESWTTTTVAHLDVMDGLVTADTLKAWTYAKSTVQSARTHTDKSQVQGLTVEGISITDVAPGAQIPLTTMLPGSYVQVYDREEHSRFPGDGSILYVADVTVTMLHIHIAGVAATPPALGLPGLPAVDPIDIVVSQARSYAQTPTPWCGLRQSAEAGAYVTRIRADGQESILLGHQHVGPTGGVAQQTYAGEDLAMGSARLQTAWAHTNATADVVVNSHSESRAVEKVGGLCIKLDDADTDCFVSAELIRAESNSRADAAGAISWGHVTIVDLKVAGIDVCEVLGMPDDNQYTSGNGNETTPNYCKPAKNTVIELGFANVTLNQRQRDAPESGHTAYYVRAVRIEAPDLGTVIIGRAFSAADYVDLR